MTRRPKDIGTAGETAVVKYLQSSGFPHAERRALHGNTDMGDITGTPGLVWEVKAGEAAMTASDNQVCAWLRETATECDNAGAEMGTLVVQRRRKNPRDWWAVTADTNGHPIWQRLSDHVLYLRAIGYGTPTGEDGVPA